MAMYIVRRLIAGFFVVLGASFIVYILVSFAGDPLEKAYGIQDPVARQQTINTLTATLNLDVNPVIRYFLWLKGWPGVPWVSAISAFPSRRTNRWRMIWSAGF